jgi:hypothetical protein
MRAGKFFQVMVTFIPPGTGERSHFIFHFADKDWIIRFEWDGVDYLLVRDQLPQTPKDHVGAFRDLATLDLHVAAGTRFWEKPCGAASLGRSIGAAPPATTGAVVNKQQPPERPPEMLRIKNETVPGLLVGQI